jgi:hypothetical protein
MDETEDSEFEVGYKKPPRKTQFKPGISGNPKGRPKKKGTTLAEAFHKELSRKIRIKEGSVFHSITKTEAIAKQHTNKAAGGDPKSTALIMGLLAQKEPEQNDNLAPIVQALRSIHARHEADRSTTEEVNDDSGSSAGTAKTDRDDQ